MPGLLAPTIITTAGTATGPTWQLRVPAAGLASSFMSAQATFTYGSGGTSVQTIVQTSFDGGATWCDAIGFANFTTGSGRFIATLIMANQIGAAATDGTLGGATAANTNVFANWWRVKYISAGTYAGGTTLRVDVFSNSNLNAAGVGSFN
jgi:hypothetical protein